MVFLSRIRFRGFKSFKRADVQMANGYVALAGPNGSGKSNVTDAIRFALGEMALKSLRAKRVSELINIGCRQADVTLFFEGEKNFEIRRAIKVEGSNAKIAYKLNGKKTTRTGLLEALRPYGIEASTHNIIAQGQVQQIIEMNAKERRQIIDEVAGIAEYEAKKKEALGELGKVEQRISDAKIVLAEREGFLGELETEKNNALAYLEAQKSLKSARATLVGRELEKLEKDFKSVGEKLVAMRQDVASKEKEAARISSEIAAIEEKKAAVFAKINQISKKDASVQAIAQLKAGIDAAKKGVSEKLAELERIFGKSKDSAKQLEAAEDSLQKIEQEIARLKIESDKVQREVEKMERLGTDSSISSQIEKVKSEQGLISAQLEQKKEEFVRLDAEISKIEEFSKYKSEEMQKLSIEENSQKGQDTKLRNELGILKKDIADGTREIEKLFSREKELNREIPDLDKKILELREKVAIARASAGSGGTSPAIAAIKEASSKSALKGVCGTVTELIRFNPDYATAIEAAANQRLNYVVVETVDDASKAIDYLKLRKAGRCTFIPLDKIMPGSNSELERLRKSDGVLGSLMDFVKYDAKYYGAMAYVFADTLLVESFTDAKKIGPGRARMVTVAGELFEKSGIISGGFLKSGALSRVALDKLESDANDAKASREEMLGTLYSIREEMSKKRKEIASLEVSAKGIEIELASMSGAERKNEEAKSDASKAKKQIEAFESQLKDKKKELDAIEKEIEQATRARDSLAVQLSSLEAKSKTESKDSGEAYAQAVARRSELAATIKGEVSKRELYAKQIAGLKNEKGSYEKEAKDGKAKLAGIEAEIDANSKALMQKEHELSEISKAVEKQYAQAKAYEEEISQRGKQSGKLKFEMEQAQKSLNELEVKKAAVEARLPDLKAEFENYKGVEMLEANREALVAQAKESEAKMSALGNVNLMAPQLYEEKKKDIEEVKGKLDKLQDEKAAVFQMIEEIEAKKHAIFMDTFKAISDNFKKIFGYIFKGEGLLVLEKPTDPFNGGLSMKINEGSHERYIESMSGGEKSLLAIIFIFAIQTHKPSSFYILDEADAALDKENSKKLAQLLRQMSTNTQFIVVTHNDAVLAEADVVLGVSKTQDGSQIVGIELTGRAHKSSAPVMQQAKATGKAGAKGTGEDEEDDIDFAEDEKLQED